MGFNSGFKGLSLSSELRKIGRHKKLLFCFWLL